MVASLTVIIPTLNRGPIIEKAVNYLRENLLFDGEIHYLIGCDGNDDTPQRLANVPRLTCLEAPKRGLGANLNFLLKNTHTDLIYQQDDDGYLLKKLDLTPFARKLMEDASAGWIRFMWVGFHDFTARLEGVYWRVDWNSRELYIPSGRVHLKHVRFHQHYGLYPEGLRVGATEEQFCHQCKRIGIEKGGPSVMIPLFDTESGWDHVGKSYQLQGL